ncbi:MAG: Uma2 family endonuclease [Treponemataceae bacterium]
MPGPSVSGNNALKQTVRYTVADYLSWDDDQRWELINGEAFAMSPAPTRKHQKLAGSLYHGLCSFLSDKPCEPYISPIDVFLSPLADQGDDIEDTVVQPDVLVVCDPSKLAEEGIRGAPDFIAEILSDSTANKDLTRKRDLYEAHGVREYWIVSPENGSVLTYTLQDRRFLPVREFRAEESVPSSVISGFIWGPRKAEVPAATKK